MQLASKKVIDAFGLDKVIETIGVDKIEAAIAKTKGKKRKSK